MFLGEAQQAMGLVGLSKAGDAMASPPRKSPAEVDGPKGPDTNNWLQKEPYAEHLYKHLRFIEFFQEDNELEIL